MWNIHWKEMQRSKLNVKDIPQMLSLRYPELHRNLFPWCNFVLVRPFMHIFFSTEYLKLSVFAFVIILIQTTLTSFQITRMTSLVWRAIFHSEQLITGNMVVMNMTLGCCFSLGSHILLFLCQNTGLHDILSGVEIKTLLGHHWLGYKQKCNS